MVARAETIVGAMPSPVVRPSLTPSLCPPAGWWGLEGPPGFGLTRLGLAMMVEAARRGPIAYVDVRVWLCPPAAWELGIPPERLVVVRCDDTVMWGRVVGGLLDGMQAVFAEVPQRVKEAHLRKLAATSRYVTHPCSCCVRFGVSCREVWRICGSDGPRDRVGGSRDGFGRLTRRRLVMEASGKVMQGMARIIEVEDHGTHAVRVDPGWALRRPDVPPAEPAQAVGVDGRVVGVNTAAATAGDRSGDAP